MSDRPQSENDDIVTVGQDLGPRGRAWRAANPSAIPSPAVSHLHYCCDRDGGQLNTCPGHATFGEDCLAWDAHMADLFVADDAEGEPTLWRITDRPDYPSAVLRRCDLPPQHRDLWDRLVSSPGVGEGA